MQAMQEFGLIIGCPDVRERFHEDLMKWAMAVINYSRETQLNSSAIQQVVGGYSEDCSAGKSWHVLFSLAYMSA